MARTVIGQCGFTSKEILFLLRRDAEFRHTKTLTNEELFTEALSTSRWNPPVDLREQAAHDYHAFVGGAQPPDYIREAITAIMGAQK